MKILKMTMLLDILIQIVAYAYPKVKDGFITQIWEQDWEQDWEKDWEQDWDKDWEKKLGNIRKSSVFFPILFPVLFLEKVDLLVMMVMMVISSYQLSAFS